MKKPLALFLAILALLALSACSTSSPAATTASAASASAAVEPTATAGPPVLLQVFSLPSNKSGLQDNWFADVLLEKLNIQIELLPTGDQGVSKYQALLASGELSDIVVFNDKKQIDDAIRGNMLLNLDEHLDKLPNVQKNAASALQFYRDNASNGTGKAYSIPNMVGPSVVGDDINYGPFMRWDLYKKLGMPEVKTLEDYLPLIRKMLELEPTTPDGQKVYGMTLWKDWDGFTMYLAMESAAIYGKENGDNIGGSIPFVEIDFNTGTTKSILDPTSEYIRCLKFYYQANQMGLIDPDSLTQRFDTAMAKADQGRVAFSWWPWFIGGYNVPEHTDIDNFTGYRPVLPTDYKALWYGDNPVGSTWSWSIGATTKYVDACLSYVDFMYSTDGLMIMMNGPQGLIWDVGSDGKPFVTEAGWDYIENQKELPGGGKINEASFVNSYGLSPMFINPTYNTIMNSSLWESSLGRNPKKLELDWQKTTGYKNTTSMLKDKKMYTMTPLAMNMLPSISDDIQTLSDQIKDIVKTNSWKMVFAKDQAEFDALYAEMTDTAKSLGIDTVIDWVNNSWKTAQETAAKYK